MADEIASELLNNGFEEIDRVARMGESYMRSLAEAAYRGDAVETLVHLKQVRSCAVHMIKTYKDWVDDQGVAEGAFGPPHAHREDQRSGDVVA